MKRIVYILTLLITVLSCNNTSKTNSNGTNQSTINKESTNKDDETNASNYHTDPDYEYEYRTGNSGDYTYNYDITGSDQDGNDVSGNIDINGKYGSGTIIDADGNEKNVDVEWVNKGALEGTDEDGNSYDLDVE